MEHRRIANGDLSHSEALELAAATALSRGDLDQAFALADRRCRSRPAPEAQSYILRAEAAYRLGRKRAALADLGLALAIAPEDPGANRRILNWGKGPAQARAASVLISAERDPKVLREALRVLRQRGQLSFAAVTILDDAIRGWAAWQESDSVTLTITGPAGTVSLRIEADPFHALSGGATEAGAFRVSRQRTTDSEVVALADGHGIFLSVEAAPNESEVAPVPATVRTEGGESVAVIVPVHADFAATRTCLDILAAELAGASPHRAILVNDAAPDPRMAPYLAKLAHRSGITVLTNPRNLGFVGSVNRGLAAAEGSDVLLLNADTVPPAGFIDRLAAAARSAADIGLVVPLSNNAELTSFPVPGEANPLPGRKKLAVVDRIAAGRNKGKLVDIPAGTGFCLYVRRDCLTALGGKLGRYHRGYLEDIDLCLRARELGFRTVCDPSVYVGHVGTRSFGAEKAALVLRNFRLLEERFPFYAAECEAFTELDPLGPARAAIVQGHTSGRAAPWA